MCTDVYLSLYISYLCLFVFFDELTLFYFSNRVRNCTGYLGIVFTSLSKKALSTRGLSVDIVYIFVFDVLNCAEPRLLGNMAVSYHMRNSESYLMWYVNLSYFNRQVMYWKFAYREKNSKLIVNKLILWCVNKNRLL